jgi:hypothetical protein
MAAAPPSFPESHARDLAANPPDLTFRLNIEGQKFHLGQRIPLKLSLASTSPKKYQALTSNFDRSGRLQSEEFVVDSSDARDPSADYFGSGVVGGIGGGPRSFAILETKPVDIEFPLNDWIRFDRAGRYRLYLKTHRLSRERVPADEPGDSSTIHFAATSNIIEVEILPADAGWQAQKLLELNTILDAITGPPQFLTPPEDQKLFDARCDLRYLGTPAAVELAFELARREGRVDTLLLVGARNRSAMLKSFDAYLSDPDVDTAEWHIRLRAMFRYIERDKVEPLPFALWQMNGKTWQDIAQKAAVRQGRFEEILREEASRLIPAVTAKKPEARKSLVDAIAILAPDAARRAGLIEPDPLDLPREELIRRFASFTKEQQERLLDGKKWDAVRGAEMIPLLREMLRKVAAKPFGPNSMFASVWGGDETALLRLAELSPVEAKRLVFARLAAGDAVFGSYAVRMLAAEPLATADGAFRKAIAAKEFGALPIIARFGSANLLPAMLELHRTTERGTCWDEATFLGYFTRVAPTADAKRMLSEAMNHREKRACWRMQFAQIASVGRKEVIEAQALTTLRDDPDPELVASSAQVLAGGGGPEMEGPLWKRLEQWSAKWRGREVELRGRPIQGGGDVNESRLGEALFQSISSAKSWIIDEARRKRMLGLCIDEDCKQRWGKDHGDGTVRVEVSSGGSLYPTAFRMESYSYPTLDGLKEKMKQYPKGTAFRWCPQENPFDFMSAGQREDLYRALSASAAGISLTLEPYDKQLCAFRPSR